MSQEKNKSTLIAALKKLPDQPVRDKVWSNIEQQLVLQESLQELPMLIPPPAVWDGIEEELETKTRTIHFLRKIAAVGILLSIGLWWFNANQNNTSTTLSYTQEQVDQRVIQVDWDTEAIEMEDLAVLCQHRQFACADASFKSRQTELNELESVKQELVQAINTYGKDATLIGQLKDLEIERTVVIREMYQSLL